MAESEKELSREENAVLLYIGVYKNDSGGYYYGKKTDNDGNITSEGIVITSEEARVIADQILASDAKTLSYYQKGRLIEGLLEKAGYTSDDDGNYYTKDGKLLSPQELINIARDTNQNLNSQISQIASSLKDCGVTSCSTNLDLHAKDTGVAAASQEPKNIFDTPTKEPSQTAFNLAEMKKTIGAMDFLKGSKLEEFTNALKAASSNDPETFAPIDMDKFSKTDICKELVTKFGESFVKKYIIANIEKAHLNSNDPSAQAQFLMSQLDNSIIGFQKELKGHGVESVKAGCAVDYNTSILPNSVTGLIAGCYAQARF